MFKPKKYNGQLYKFEHLNKFVLTVFLNASHTLSIDVIVEFSCHCFTEDFDHTIHGEGHKYIHRGELRAFDLLRYECSLQLPNIVSNIADGMVYLSDKKYTYTARINIDSSFGLKTYSIFFNLRQDRELKDTLYMKIVSAYLKPSVAKPNAQGWRFKSLAGQIACKFPPPGKGEKT